MNWVFDKATGALWHGATLIGEGAASLAPGEYHLGDVTDLGAGIPLIGAGAGACIGYAPDMPGIVVPPDVMQRVIASQAVSITVVDSALVVEPDPEAAADPAEPVE